MDDTCAEVLLAQTPTRACLITVLFMVAIGLVILAYELVTNELQLTSSGATISRTMFWLKHCFQLTPHIVVLFTGLTIGHLFLACEASRLTSALMESVVIYTTLFGIGVLAGAFWLSQY